MESKELTDLKDAIVRMNGWVVVPPVVQALQSISDWMEKYETTIWKPETPEESE